MKVASNPVSNSKYYLTVVFTIMMIIMLLGTVSAQALALNSSYKSMDPLTEEDDRVEMLNVQLELSKKIYFKSGTAALRSTSNEVLENIYEILSANRYASVEIGGHMDNSGIAAADEAMSYNRAMAVKGWLMRKGIDSDRMTVKGYGVSQPLSNANDRLSQESNRRIEIKVVQ